MRYNYFMKLILCRGIPGSGKSTFAINNFPGIFHIENDMFHMKNGIYSFDFKLQNQAVAWCMNTCENALKNGMDVIVSNTFTKRKYIMNYFKIAQSFNAEFIVYRLNGSFKNNHSVPNNVFENMKNGFEDWPGEIIVTPIQSGYKYIQT